MDRPRRGVAVGESDYKQEIISEIEISQQTGKIRLFNRRIWIPDWQKSIPESMVKLNSLPASCLLDLQRKPRVLLEVNLEGESALQSCAVMQTQGSYVPIQFDGLQYDSYPIKLNNYCEMSVTNEALSVRGEYQVIDEGLRILRNTDSKLSRIQAIVINLALRNAETILASIDGWQLEFSPFLGDSDTGSSFLVTHLLTMDVPNESTSDQDIEEFVRRIKTTLSVFNMNCSDVIPVVGLDCVGSIASYMVMQPHCDEYQEQNILDGNGTYLQRGDKLAEMLIDIFDSLSEASVEYLMGVEYLTCDRFMTIPLVWSALEKMCGSSRKLVRRELNGCVDSLALPSEHNWILSELRTRKHHDFIDVFDDLRNYLLHQKNGITRGRPLSPEISTKVLQLGYWLCWAKLVADMGIDCWPLRRAKTLFANWTFKQIESGSTMVDNFSVDQSMDLLSALDRLAYGPQKPGTVSALLETPDGKILLFPATAWPTETPEDRTTNL